VATGGGGFNLPFADVRKYLALRLLMMKINGFLILLASDNENPASYKAKHTHAQIHTQAHTQPLWLLMMSSRGEIFNYL